MRRRQFIGTLAGALLTGGIVAPATAQTVVRVGILTGASISTPANVFREAFLHVLRQRGWEEGKNLIIEARATEGRAERYAEHAAELVALRIDVAVGSGSQGVQALKAASSTIPIVMLDVSHPIEAGLISSLARPGGNITGVTPQLDEVNAKALELLRELEPDLGRAGILYTPSNAGSALALKESLERIPQRLGMSLVPVPIDSAADIETAFAVIDREGLRAVHIHPTPVIGANRQRIAGLLIERRIPAVTGFNTLVRDGILMSYGPDQVESWRGAATYVDRILRGDKPADLPVQRPTKFQLVINLKTARAMGLTVPPTLLARADEVIE
jgi:putative tryptophan/tyrosine transport system substrate-binding protein